MAFQLSGDSLRQYVTRIERIESEKDAIMEDLRQVYKEAKANGYDVKILRKLIRIRKMDSAKRHEEEELLEMYESAVGK